MNSRKVLKLVSISEVASKMESMKRTWSDWRCAYDTQNGLSRHVPPASDAEGSAATFKAESMHGWWPVLGLRPSSSKQQTSNSHHLTHGLAKNKAVGRATKYSSRNLSTSSLSSWASGRKASDLTATALKQKQP